MSNFTSGPWKSVGGNCTIVTEDPNGWEIADIRPDVPGFEANAALIAAAPDLLAALEEILDGYLYGCDMKTKRENIKKANAAIARARGEV